jgi:hypothetical protein
MSDEFELSMSSTIGVEPPDKARLRVNMDMELDWKVAAEVFRIIRRAVCKPAAESLQTGAPND